MKKTMLFSILIFLVASPSWATTYYANALNGQNIDYTTGGAGWYPTDTGDCTGSGTPVAIADMVAGSVLDANNCTGIIVNTDPGPNGKVVLNTPQAGTFVITSAGTYTITADIGVSGSTGTTDVLTIGSGANAITATILGNIYGGGTASADGLVLTGSGVSLTIGAEGSPVTIKGGTISSCLGVNDGHTVTTVAVYANIEGATAHGYSLTQTGSVAIYGNVTGGPTAGANGVNNGNSSGTITITGNAKGSDSAQSCGAATTSTGGVITVTGNLYFGEKGSAVSGNIRWTPARTNYALFPINATGEAGVISANQVMAGPVADGNSYSGGDTYLSEDEIKSGETCGSATGTLASSGGGGAWGF